MSGSLVSFRANGSAATGYVSLPPTGRGPGLILLQEFWGLVGHITALADRFAASGFAVIAPDLYRGEVGRSPDEARKLMMALDIADTAKALRGAAEHLIDNGLATTARVGALGFCMGGQLALFAAQEHPDRIGVAVDFYGIHPKVPIEPARIRVPILGHFATRDKSVPPAVGEALFASVRAAGGTAESYVYDAGHAFFNDERPEVYSQENAVLAWERSLAFLARHLT
jgi:carboxymethylenebutenolidase